MERIRPAHPQAALAATYRVLPESLELDMLLGLSGPASAMGHAGAAAGRHTLPPHAAKESGIGDRSRPFLASLPGAEIALLKLEAGAGPNCDSVEITFAGEESATRATRIESLVKFQPPAADSSADGSDSAALRWLDRLDNFIEAKSDAGISSLVLGASGILGIWLARIKRSRAM